MKKKILVSVDAGETRVAVLEAKGVRRSAAAARTSRPDERQRQVAGRRALRRAPRLALDRRQHLQGRRRQRPARHGGGVRRHRAGAQRLPARRRDRHPRRQGGAEARPRPGPADRRADQARPGDRRPGRQGPAEDEGRAALDAALDRRPLPRLHAAGRAASASAAGSPTPSATRCARALEKVRTTRKQAGKGGYIVRTAAQGAKKEDFEREIAYLHKLHEVLERRSEDVEAPSLDLPGGGPLDPGPARRPRQRVRRGRDRRPEAVRAGHDVLPADRAGARRLGRDALTHASTCSSAYGAEEAFRSTLSRRVDLPSGGYLIIDYAEALTVIDINTGCFTGKGKGRLEDTITKVNVEAADEVVRQLRLRDIGGIIVIDFIDMARAKNRDQVLKTLRKALDEDRTKTYVVEVSPLGLVEMTRQNVTDGVREILTTRCPTCDGEGVVRSAETVAIEVLRKLRDVVTDQPEPEAHLIRVNPKVARELMRHDSGPARARGGDRQARSCSRAATRCRSTPSRSPSPATRERDRAPGAAVPARRRGAALDRRAAHVQPRRRGRQGRCAGDHGHRRGAARRRAQAGPDRGDRAARRGVATAGRRASPTTRATTDPPTGLESGARRRGRRGGRRRSRAGSGSRRPRS